MSRRDAIADRVSAARQRLDAAGIKYGSQFLNELRADLNSVPCDPPPAIVFRNDHGPGCTCLDCVARRIGFPRVGR